MVSENELGDSIRGSARVVSAIEAASKLTSDAAAAFDRMGSVGTQFAATEALKPTLAMHGQVGQIMKMQGRVGQSLAALGQVKLPPSSIRELAKLDTSIGLREMAKFDTGLGLRGMFGADLKSVFTGARPLPVTPITRTFDPPIVTESLAQDRTADNLDLIVEHLMSWEARLDARDEITRRGRRRYIPREWAIGLSAVLLTYGLTRFFG